MKIAYIREHHPTTGTLYNQRLTVTPSEFKKINDIIKTVYYKTETETKKAHKITSEQMSILYFCKPLNDGENKVFLNLKHLDIIFQNFFIPRLKYRNTVIYIKG